MQLLPIEFAIKAILIAVGTAGVLRILDVRTAAARHAAWAGVVVVMLLLPVWTIWGPKVAWHLLPPLPEQAVTRVIAAADTFEPAIGSPLAPRHPSWNWTACLLGIYLVGVAVFLVRLTLGTLQAQPARSPGVPPRRQIILRRLRCPGHRRVAPSRSGFA
jgi:hypothetical protein